MQGVLNELACGERVSHSLRELQLLVLDPAASREAEQRGGERDTHARTDVPTAALSPGVLEAAAQCAVVLQRTLQATPVLRLL